MIQSTIVITIYAIQYALQNEKDTLCKMYNAKCTIHSEQNAQNEQCKIYDMHYSPYTLHNAQCNINNAKCTLINAQC